jgi:hypothetical protein
MWGPLRIKDRDDLPSQEMASGEGALKSFFLFAHGSRMEKFFKSYATKSLIALSFLSFACILASGLGTHYLSQNEKQIVEVKYGMNVCFGRLTQSMLAIMHIDLNSKSLSRDFFEQTNECFVQFKNDLKAQGIREESAPYQSIKELIANVLDFHRQMGIITARPKDTLQINAIQTEITPHYTKVDRDRFAFNQLIGKELAGPLSNNSGVTFFLFTLGLVAAALLTFGFAFLAWKKQERLKQLAAWESIADDLSITALENSLRIENFFVEVWKSDGLNNTLKLFKSYHEKLLERTFALSNLRAASVRKDLEVVLDLSELQPGKLSLSSQSPIFHEGDEVEEDVTKSWEISNSQLESIATQDTMSEINYYNTQVEESLSSWDEESIKNEDLAGPIEIENSITQGVNFWETIRKVEMRLSSELDDKLSISVKKYEAGINLISASEILEQLTYSIFQKFHKMFAQFGTPFTQRDVNLALKFDPLENKANITFVAQATLFSLDDLEYFSTHSDEADPVQIPLQVDTTSRMIRELLRSVNGSIRIQNILSDDAEPQKCQIMLVIPAIQMQDRDPEEISRSERSRSTGTLTQVIKGKKKDILQNIVKEITI